MFGLKTELITLLIWLVVQRIKPVFYLIFIYSINDMKYFQNVFVVDCCQFGFTWNFGLKTDLMACADLVGGTTEQGCLFPDPI